MHPRGASVIVIRIVWKVIQMGHYSQSIAQVLDLSHNLYDMRPSQLEDQLRTLALLHQLTWLKVRPDD